MKSNITLTLLTAFWGLAGSLSCLAFTTVSDANQLTKITSEIADDACVIWDVHYTLIRPKSDFLSWAAYNQNKDIIE